jgi:hypothetical protein
MLLEGTAGVFHDVFWAPAEPLPPPS